MSGMVSGTVSGYLAKDPELGVNGKAAKFSIPVSKGKDKPTTWIRVTAWGKAGEFVMQYCRKGSLVTATGELEMREYDSPKGKGVSLDMSANSVTAFRVAGDAPAAAPTPTTPANEEDFSF